MGGQTLNKVWTKKFSTPDPAQPRAFPPQMRQVQQKSDLPNTQFAFIQEGMHISVSLGDMCIPLGSAASRAGDS